MAKLIGIQFIRGCSPYNEGDKVGFIPATAAGYVKGGFATYLTTAVIESPVVKSEKAAPAPEPSPPPSKPKAEEPKAEEPRPEKKKKKRLLSRVKKKMTD